MVKMDDDMKQVVDTVSVATAVGTVAAVLPPLAALFTIVWTLIRIWETDTVQHLFQKNGNGTQKAGFCQRMMTDA